MKKTYFKKSIALLMTIMMLMTCWVFVAPEKAQAAALGNYTISVKFQTNHDDTNGHIKVYYYTTMDENGNLGGAVTDEIHVNSIKSDVTGGNKGTYTTTTQTISGWPYAIYIQNDTGIGWNAGANKEIRFLGLYISGVEASGYVAAGKGYNVERDKKYTFVYNDGKDYTANWHAPTPTTVSLSSVNGKTVEVPGSLSGLSGTVKDQYGVVIPRNLTYSFASYTGLKINDGTNAVTASSIKVSATTEALTQAVSNYNSSTGKGQVTLSASCGAATPATATLNLQSVKYKVNFFDGNGDDFGTQQQCYYGGSVSYPSGTPIKAADTTNHYAFKQWPSGANTNITKDTDITAEFTGTPHNFMDTSIKAEPVTGIEGNYHWRKCNGCDYYKGWEKETGGKQKCDHSVYEENDDATLHTSECPTCGKKISHEPVWVEDDAIKYGVPGAEQSCTTDALYYKSCSVCGLAHKSETFTPEDGKAWGHDFDSVTGSGETHGHSCTEPGYVLYYCANGCGKDLKDIYLRDVNGEYSLDELIKEESEEYGVIYYVPDANGNKIVFDPAAHAWSNNLEDKGDGQHGYPCSECDEWNNSADHDWTLEKTITPPTCNKAGEGTFTCGCGARKTDIIPADGVSHNYDYTKVTSKNDGTHSYFCDYCNKEINEACVDENKDCVCDICKYNIPHVYGNNVVADYLVSEADCNNYAVYWKSCNVCGTKIDESATDPTFEDVASGYGPHDWSATKKFNKSPASCETDAVYYYECLECGTSSQLVDGSTWTEEGSGYDHVWDKTDYRDNGDGTHSFKCKNGCGTYGATENCTYGDYADGSNGYHYRYCSVCDHGEEKEHNWSKWTPVDTGAETAGSHTRYCIDCNRTETVECEYEAVFTEATCLKDAYTTYSCSACGHGYTVIDKGTMLDHDYSGEYEIDTENDMHRQRCLNGCDEYNPVWTACTLEYKQVEGTETHSATCPDCGNVDTGDCYGGTATCVEKAKCDKCGGYHGDFADHDFSETAINVSTGKHHYSCKTDGCDKYGVGTVEGATEDCFGGTAYCDAPAVCEACKTYHGDKDPNSHRDTTPQPGLDPTCMMPGYTAYETCDNCPAVIGKEVIEINPEAHAWDLNNPVSTDDGKHYYVCLNKDADGKQCDKTAVVDCECTSPSILAPTCTEGGYTLHTCDECGYEWKTDLTDPIGHSYGAWTNIEGTETHIRYCLNDNTHTETGTCFDAKPVVTAPTCTEQGFTTHTCDDCGHVWVTTYVDPLGHDYTQKIIDEAHEHNKVATCTNAPYYWFDCSRCDKNAKDETDFDKYPADSLYYENGTGEGHNWKGKVYSEDYDFLVLATAATCDKNERYYVYCTVCHASSKGVDGVEDTFENWGSALQHSYQDIVDEKDLTKNIVSVATCTAKAVYNKSCANCGDVSDDTFTYGEMLDHDYSETKQDMAHRITEATCNSNASYWYDCKVCNSNAKLIDKSEMTDEEIAALKYEIKGFDKDNHTDLETIPVKNPTCTEAGYSAYEHCSACNKDFGKKEYAKKNHDYTGAYVCENVTAEDGTVTYKHKRACKYGCGEYSAVRDCSFRPFVQNEDGKTHTQSCICGNSITGDCEANENATCTQAATCKICAGEIADSTVGHDYPDTWTSSDDGKTHYRLCNNNPNHKEVEDCSDGDMSGCGAVLCAYCGQNYGTATNHKWGAWVDTAEATCTTPAKHKRICGACGLDEEVEYGEALGHDYDDGVVTKVATCTEAGIKTFTCKNGCGDSYTEVIKSLGHEYDAEWTTTKLPTCKDEGEQTKYCTHSWVIDGETIKCDEKITQVIPADRTKHVPGDWVQDTSASNCSTGLRSYRYCTVCGLKVDEKIEKIDHDWVAEVIVKGTCTENGYIEMKCAKCETTARFDDTCATFPNQFDSTIIDGDIASSLLSKNGHAWRKQALAGESKFIIQDGYVVYIDKAASCSQTGRGYMICDECGVHSATVTIAKTAHNLKTINGSDATCQTPGYLSYQACKNCPYAEEQIKLPALGHADGNANGKCDRCGFQMYETDSGVTTACGCICHSTSFFTAKIIYPIARFFWKIFGMNHSCSCGREHY